jgi:hypothetical protein
MLKAMLKAMLSTLARLNSNISRARLIQKALLYSLGLIPVA